MASPDAPPRPPGMGRPTGPDADGGAVTALPPGPPPAGAAAQVLAGVAWCRGGGGGLSDASGQVRACLGTSV
jgi:hypothetical protein